MTDLLSAGTRVAWNQRETGRRNEGVILFGFHGYYGPTYRCRADQWSSEWGTYVVGADMEVLGTSEHTD